MDKEEKQAGQGFKGYGTFVKTGADGTTAKVGTNIPTRGKADNSFQYAEIILLIQQMENSMVNYLII